MDRAQSRKHEKRILDILSRGLSTEFPNSTRTGCPGSAILEGIASHATPLSASEAWLDHLGSCSACFQDFTAIRRKLRTRRGYKVGGGLAVVVAVFALWMGLSRNQTIVRNEAASLDLRPYSVERGEETTSNEPPLPINRRTKHLTLYLPVGSKEGNYDLGLLNDKGDELLHTTGIAGFENHVLVLRADVDISSVSPGSYFLGLRKLGLRWALFPVRVR
jgi:hypothetical protein